MAGTKVKVKVTQRKSTVSPPTCVTNLIQLKGSVKELNMFHNYETEKITRKASDATEYIELFVVLPPEIVMHSTFNVIL